MQIVVVGALVAAALFIGRSIFFGGKYSSVTPQEAQKMLAEKRVFILDVRTPGEYGQGRIKGAVLIPTAEVGCSLGKIPRDRAVLIYCASGARSRMVASMLSRKGYPELFNLAGGIYAWQRGGFPVQR